MKEKENIELVSLYSFEKEGKPSDVYKEVDIDLLKKVRMKQTGDFKQFKSDVSGYINVGIPLVWSVIVGKVDEDPLVDKLGGHARLIIGYNPKTAEIIYTDSWGAIHEFKRMSVDDAWSITTGLYTIEPSNWHYTNRGRRDTGF